MHPTIQSEYKTNQILSKHAEPRLWFRLLLAQTFAMLYPLSNKHYKREEKQKEQIQFEN
jgi:hypothetical protein